VYLSIESMGRYQAVLGEEVNEMVEMWVWNEET
jgi:hypothetical protein